jgi:hypothetical protein
LKLRKNSSRWPNAGSLLFVRKKSKSIGSNYVFFPQTCCRFDRHFICQRHSFGTGLGPGGGGSIAQSKIPNMDSCRLSTAMENCSQGLPLGYVNHSLNAVDMHLNVFYLAGPMTCMQSRVSFSLQNVTASNTRCRVNFMFGFFCSID